MLCYKHSNGLIMMNNENGVRYYGMNFKRKKGIRKAFKRKKQFSQIIRIFRKYNNTKDK